MPSTATLNVAGGSIERFTLRLQAAVQPSEGDALYAGQRQRTRIIERTLRGVDVDGSPFAPYSTKGPYYWYPNGRVGKTPAEAKQNKSAVDRLIKKLGNSSHTTVMSSARMSKMFGIDIVGDQSSGYGRTRNGQGIKFASYAAFKASLGRLGVDLMGPRAPHMLQAIAVGVSFERTIGDEQQFALNDRPNLAHELTIGIYGEESDRAAGHNEGTYNEGTSRLPRRHFLGASEAEQDMMLLDMQDRMIARAQQALTLKT